MSTCKQSESGTRQCYRLDCVCCVSWMEDVIGHIDRTGKAVEMAETFRAQRDELARALRESEGAAARLEAERQRYAELNRRPNARANGIRAVTACEKKESSGRRGRPSGKGATVNRQFEESEADARETADLGACPGCGG